MLLLHDFNLFSVSPEHKNQQNKNLSGKLKLILFTENLVVQIFFLYVKHTADVLHSSAGLHRAQE